MSAKLGDSKEIEALSSAQEYEQSIGEMQTLSEVFALTYPAARAEKFRLRALATSFHDALSWTLDSLAEVAIKIDKMLRQALDEARQFAEPEEAAVIRVLRQGVEDLSLLFGNVEDEEVEAIFGGRTFFETVLGYEEEERVQLGYLRTAAAYLLVNQLLFYERLVSETRKYPEITDDDLKEPTKLKPNYFDLVLRDDYRPIFNFDVAGRLNGREAGDAVRRMILALRALSPGRLRRDILGKVFHNLIPLGLRKVVAAYFTNASAADLLAALAIDSSDATVADFACGSGTLLVAAYNRKRGLLKGESNLNAEEHRRFVEEDLTGVDIMPFSSHLAAVHLALQAPLYQTDNLRIIIKDSTALIPGNEVSAAREVLKEAFKNRKLEHFDGETLSPKESTALSGSLSLGPTSAPVKLGTVDVVIMNPPFTRHERLTEKYKARLERRFEPYKRYFHGQLSFHGFFMFLADRFLNDGGTLALVLPATTLRLRGAAGARQMLVDKYSVDYIITTFQRAAFSEDAEFREVLLLARKTNPET